MHRLAMLLLGLGLSMSLRLGAEVTAAVDIKQADSLATLLQRAPHTDRIIVRLKGGENGAAGAAAKSVVIRESLAKRLGQRAGKTFSPHRVMGDNAQVIKLNRRHSLQEIDDIARALAQDPDVLEVIPDRLAFPQLTPNDPQYANQWALSAAQGRQCSGCLGHHHRQCHAGDRRHRHRQIESRRPGRTLGWWL